MRVSSVSPSAHFSALYRLEPTDHYWLDQVPRRPGSRAQYSSSTKQSGFLSQLISKLFKNNHSESGVQMVKPWTAKDARLSIVDQKGVYKGQQVFADHVAQQLGFQKAGLNRYAKGSHPILIGYRNPIHGAEVFVAVDPTDAYSSEQVKLRLNKMGMVTKKVNKLGRSGQVLTPKSEYVQGKENHPYATYVPQVAVAEVTKK